MNSQTFVNTNPNTGGGLTNPDPFEIGSELISLTCISVLAVAVGLKTHGETLSSVNYGRGLVIALYVFSWAFAVASIIIVSTNQNNIISCTLGMLGCDFFYSGAKIVIYMWLIERVHVVTAAKTTRFRTGQYKFHILLLCPYIIISALMLSYRNIYLEANGTCTIGLQDIASIPLLVYDFVFNLYLTWLFLQPLMSIGRSSRENWKQSRLYKLAKRTLVASVVCLSISFVNVLFVVLSHGHLRGLVCLSLCTIDVTVNVITVHWVTTSSSGSGNGRSKASNDEQLSADMTFERDDHEEEIDFEDNSVKSAEISQTSKTPISHYYN